MTVKTLKAMIANAPDDAIVYLENPHLFKDNQEAHELAGARYTICDGECLWFERYCDEEIQGEIDAIEEVAMLEMWGDEEFADEVLNPHRHGYTLEDIRKNCNKDTYAFVVKTAEEHGLI